MDKPFNRKAESLGNVTGLEHVNVEIPNQALASDFYGEWNVPTQAITMGLGTIFDARKVLLLALGEHKASIIREVAEGPVSPACRRLTCRNMRTRRCWLTRRPVAN